MKDLMMGVTITVSTFIVTIVVPLAFFALVGALLGAS